MLVNYSASAATRVYLMRGLGELSPFGPLIAALHARRAVVSNWSWLNYEAVVTDALRHRRDRIIVAGHSMGDLEAFRASAELAARGLKATTIGLDPLCTWPLATKGLVQYNILGNACGGQYHTVRGAHNVFVRGTGHIMYPTDRRVISLFLRYAFP